MQALQDGPWAESLSPSRRKLLDGILAGFVVGNTNARSLVTKAEAKGFAASGAEEVSLLFLGVGDVRNPLKTVHALWNAGFGGKIRICVNDACVMTLARDLVLLRLIERKEFDAAIQIWSDALLSEETYKILKKTLATLRDEATNSSTTSMSLFRFKGGSKIPEALVSHWISWFEAAPDFDEGLTRRTETLERMGNMKGHGRTGVSQFWIKYGASSRLSCELTKLTCVNPTLYDFLSTQRPRYVDGQGPSAAFACLEQAHVGTAAFQQFLCFTWTTIMTPFHELAQSGRIELNIVAGDCMKEILIESFGMKGFDAIDTSNLIDYVGIWNLLPLCEKLLKKGTNSFLATESILTSADNTEALFTCFIPHDAVTARMVAALIGLRMENLPAELLPSESERILRCRWVRHSPSEADLVHVLKARTDQNRDAFDSLRDLLPYDWYTLEHHELVGRELWSPECPLLFDVLTGNTSEGEKMDVLRQFLHHQSMQKKDKGRLSLTFDSEFFKLLIGILVPIPVDGNILKQPELAISQSYAFPSHTAFTVLLILDAICEHSKLGLSLAGNFLKRFFKDSSWHGHPHIRNRTLALRVLSSMKNVRGLPLLRVWPVKMRFTVLKELEMEIWKPRAGILEPSLALFVTNNVKTLTHLLQGNRKYKNDSILHVAVNLNFERIEAIPSTKLQIIDNFELLSKFSARTKTMDIIVNLPTTSSELCFAALVDIQQYAILTEPLDLKENSSATKS